MLLDEIVAAQMRGEAKGFAAVCSAHPWVLKETLKVFEFPLIEATCNQVNQFGGYTGMTPADFAAAMRRMAAENKIPFENVLLGGDHLGPNVWQDEPADCAMQKSAVMVRDYVQAGFVKLHLDCSMPLGDDRALPVEVAARRAAQLARVAENAIVEHAPRYVIGTEVPVPGGAKEHEDGVQVTSLSAAQETIEIHQRAFFDLGLHSAWERVVALVVQPGVEFGDDFVLEYQPNKAEGLSRFIERQNLVFEAHSTDYQPVTALKNLVRDHFAILKVGPGLTFAYREAIFALAMIETELFPADERSNMLSVLDDVMLRHPQHWQKYYPGTAAEQAFKRKFSLSDRIRYYWVQPEVQAALGRLRQNLSRVEIPFSLMSQFAPEELSILRDEGQALTADNIISKRVRRVLEGYRSAC
jgi:D-tagatose-1,6-bisphosphate aldolase subunit GatZ/KbaZ